MTVFGNLIVSFSSLVWLASAFAGQTTVGATYDIAEPDILEEIQAKAGKVDWRGAMNHDRETWSAWASVPAPEAKQNREHRFVPNYALDFDVTDKTGAVVYPKGFQFNPLEYVQLPGRILVIGKSEQQAQWAKASRRDGDFILTAGGDPLKLAEEIGQPVYLLDERGAQRLGVVAVPSIVEQNGHEFVVKQIYVKTK